MHPTCEREREREKESACYLLRARKTKFLFTALSERGEVKSDRSPRGKYRAPCRAFSPFHFLRPSTSELLSHPSRCQSIRRRPASAPVPSPTIPVRYIAVPSLSFPTLRLCSSRSFYLSVASLLAVFHEAQHLPVVTKKSSNHPRRSSGGLSFALRASGVGSISESGKRASQSGARERESENSGGGRTRGGKRNKIYIGRKANGARGGETERRNGATGE